MNSYDDITYVGGSKNIGQPGNAYRLRLTKDGLQLHRSPTGWTTYAMAKNKDFIAWKDIAGVDTEHQVKQSAFDSFLMTNSVNSVLIIRHKAADGSQTDLKLMFRKAEKAKEKILKQLEKMHQSVKQDLSVPNTNHKADDYAGELEKLAELKRKGVITQADFDAKKKQLLGL